MPLDEIRGLFVENRSVPFGVEFSLVSPYKWKALQDWNYEGPKLLRSLRLKGM